MNLLPLAIAALLPAMIGPLPVESKTLVITLCGSGEVLAVDIPLRDKEDRPSGSCHQDGCHAGCSRKKTAPQG